jgi:hypothetical protein
LFIFSNLQKPDSDMIKDLCSFIGFMALILSPFMSSAQQRVLQDQNVVVVYDSHLAGAAGEIIRMYPDLKQALEEFFAWGLAVRPQVLLVRDNQTFQKITHNKLFVAFAVPEKNLIVIDHSRMNIHPFTLSITLKHELCHLLLHQHIHRENLPKWLDEGICQWVSDGIGEIFVNQNLSGLDAAIMSGRIIPIKKLTHYFPRDKDLLMLAYEQSKSVIGYVDRQYGKNAILNLLDRLKNGDTVEDAVMKSIAVSLDRMEEEWLDHLESTPRWLIFLANNIYGILFFMAAVLTFFGFIRFVRRRKKLYEEWEDEE